MLDRPTCVMVYESSIGAHFLPALEPPYSREAFWKPFSEDDDELRRLARWMRMPCCTNQSSVPKAWQEFDDDGRMKASDFRNRVVDCAEEYYRFTLVMREYADELNDRFSERAETAEKGRLLTQAEKEKAKEKENMRSA